MKIVERRIPTVAEMEALGSALAREAFECGARLVYLHGPLGAGKTTLVRGMLRALGHHGAVKSPTFTLVEPYELEGGRRLYHFDLYRLEDPQELEFLGIRDYLEGQGLCVIEWAERGGGFLPEPDIDVMIDMAGTMRTVRLTAHTGQGESTLGGLC
jgi:tRNA threonylcarbamoyladenosine biosynthesis protein TsaE